MPKQSWIEHGICHEFWTRTVRPTVFRLRGKECEACSATENIDVHHTDYDNQTINTLRVLCRQCHIDWHCLERFTDEIFLGLYKKNKSDKQIASELGVSKSQVFRRRTKLGLEPTN